ncbi:MAG: HEAT repeat domain-containing protein [Myxococcales bacterium]|nr:HEAT repeat domain-containing protein [Myxococcales bacterium]
METSRPAGPGGSEDDWSWPTEVAYACACGAYSAVTRWRWVDADRRGELCRRLREAGPLEGSCGACGQAAQGAGAWLEVSPAHAEATLVLASHQRGELLEVLRTHLGHLQERPQRARPWLISPRVVFGAPRTAAPAVLGAPAGEVHEPGSAIPRPVGTRNWGSGPLLGAQVERAVVADLALEGGQVTVLAVLDEPTRKLWGSAALQARPVLLRGLGYPLLGVRLVASYLGETAVIDALIDVGDPRSTEIFVKLSQAFRLQLQVRGDTGQASSVREIEAEGLRRNAQMCLESAQAQLGVGEFPPDSYRTAREALARMPAKQRLEPARSSLGEGSYRHLVSPAETWAALERLDQASKKDNLARLIEVDGLPVPEYEAIRKSVLIAALEFGLVAPARFWRRVLGSELVPDAGAWIHKLVAQRSAWIARGDDLTPEQAEQAWRGIFDLCTHHNLTPPPEVHKALGLGKRGGEARGAASGLHVVPSGRADESGRHPRVVVEDRPAAREGRPPSAPRPAAPRPADVVRTNPREPSTETQRTRPATGSFAALGSPGPQSSDVRAGTGSYATVDARGSSTVTGSYPTVGGAAPPPRPRRSAEPPLMASGEIRSEPPKPAATVRLGGGDLKLRSNRALAALTAGDPAEALALLPELGEDEILTLLPGLAELGTRIVPDLLNMLSSSRREVRQVAVILLGHARDRRALEPLTHLLGQESTAVWIDAAWALGNAGPRVVGPLCGLIRGAPADRKELLGERVARAFAELVRSDGDAPGSAGRSAVENLLEVADPAVSSAARRALGTLAGVRGDGRGGGAEERELREFSTRALEAITAPELDDGAIAIEVVGED